MRGVVPEAEKRLLAGSKLHQVQRAFILWPAGAVLPNRTPRERRSEDSQRRLVGDRQYRIDGALMARSDLFQGGERALRDLGRCLSARWRYGGRFVDPCRVPFGVEGAHLIRREAFPAAVIDLGKIRQGFRFHSRNDQGRRLRGAPERRTVDRGEADPGEADPEPARLIAAAFGERQLATPVEGVDRGRRG